MPHFASITCGTTPNTDCADPDYRATHLGECPDDERCADPVFAAANPTLCLNSPRLFIKPSAAVVEILDDVQFRAFLWINGAETELTSGVVWSVSNAAIALIGAGSGNATGTAVGIVTVTATYGSMTATARLEVIADGACAARANHFLLLPDVSRSMSSVFSATYGTRLAVAQSIANAFIDGTDFGKDNAAVMSFDETSAAVQAFTSSEPALTAAVSGLATTALNTDLATALTDANAYFASQGVPASGRVIVLFSDGENNEGDDPVPVADAIRSAGTIIMVIGIRAKGSAFSLLERMASGGFFLNALPSNITLVDGWVDGLRQYLCSANCPPSGGVTVGVGALNFNSFARWDVTAGVVDLIGRNTGGPAMFDFLPGNGLYLDLCGSGGGVPDDKGTIRTKVGQITWLDTVDHEIRVRVAGNQREAGTDVVNVKAIGGDGSIVNEMDITVTDRTQLFTDYVLIVPTTGPTAGPGFVVISQKSIRSGGTTVFGSLLDRVTVTSLTDSVVLFDETWDNENTQTIVPGCSAGYAGYSYGYCYGQGCADGPIPAQVADPNPLPDLEGGSNPPTYSSTQTATVCCENAPTVCASASASATSTISQAAADATAYSLAQTLAQAALQCPMGVGALVNFHPGNTTKVGFAAFGLTSTDYWNVGEFNQPILDSAQVPTGLEVRWGVGGAPIGDSGWGFGFDFTRPDPLLRVWGEDQDDAFLYVVVEGLPAGTFSLYLYGHGDGDTKNGRFTLEKGEFDAVGDAIGSTTAIGTLTTAGPGWNNTPPPNFVAGVHYVTTSFDMAAGQMLRMKMEKNLGVKWHWNGFQIQRTA